MSAELITNNPRVPQFSAELIDAVLAASAAHPDEFRLQQIQTMTRFNGPLQTFFEAKLRAFGERGDGLTGSRWMDSYAVGHGILRSAVSDESPLPERQTAALHSFAKFIHHDPSALDRYLKEDYAAHPGILDSLVKLVEQSDGHTDGARLILGVYGLWANPERPPRYMPNVSESAQPTSLKTSRVKVHAASKRFKQK